MVYMLNSIKSDWSKLGATAPKGIKKGMRSNLPVMYDQRRLPGIASGESAGLPQENDYQD
jgi:hypothetical protein